MLRCSGCSSGFGPFGEPDSDMLAGIYSLEKIDEYESIVDVTAPSAMKFVGSCFFVACVETEIPERAPQLEGEGKIH